MTGHTDDMGDLSIERDEVFRIRTRRRANSFPTLWTPRSTLR